MSDIARGALIVLEGCDRVGKSTQSRLLVDNLIKRNKKAEVMNFPDRSTTIGRLLDQYVKQQLELDDHAVHLLFSANRWEAAVVMEQQLLAGTTLVLDRYSDSGVAYSAAKGLDLSWCQSSDRGLPQPDLVLFLQLNPEQNNSLGGYDEERNERQQFQTLVRDNYSKIMQHYWTTVNADNKSVEQLQDELLLEVLEAVESAAQKPIAKLMVCGTPTTTAAAAVDGPVFAGTC